MSWIVANILPHSATHAQPFAGVCIPGFFCCFLLTKVSIDTIILEAMIRPSKKELFNKLKQARKAVCEGSVFLIDQSIIAADAIDLNYPIADLENVLSQLLGEINPVWYAGTHPPQRSYESEIKGLELFAFRWASKRFGCDMYLKFALNQGHMWLVSLHIDRKKP